jgi:N-acetylneuraminic acid mutarotase
MAARLSDGTVVVAGGADSDGLASADRFDPATNSWSPIAAMHARRGTAAGVALQDGRMLVTGGGSYSASLASAEIYDGATGTWTLTNPMTTVRRLHNAITLADGRVLVVGGEGPAGPGQGAEVYDPAAGTWTLTGPVRDVREGASVVRLADGRVMVIGGFALSGADSDTQASVEIYDPATNAWTDAAPMQEARSDPAVALLPDGRVLAAGGHRFTDLHPDDLREAEIYDPVANTWTRTADLRLPRGEGNTVETLPDGRPMVIGGFWWRHVEPGPPPSWSDSHNEETAEIYDPATGTWSDAASMAVGRAGHVSAVLRDGDVLVAGGFDAGGQAERFTATPRVLAPPPAAPDNPPAPQPGKVIPAKPPIHANPSFVLSGSRHLVVSRTGRVAVRLRCAGNSPCRDELRVRSRGTKPRTLAHLRFTLRSGQTATIRTSLPRSVRHRLAGHTIPARLVLVGQRRSLDVTLRVRRS